MNYFREYNENVRSLGGQDDDLKYFREHNEDLRSLGGQDADLIS